MKVHFSWFSFFDWLIIFDLTLLPDSFSSPQHFKYVILLSFYFCCLYWEAFYQSYICSFENISLLILILRYFLVLFCSRFIVICQCEVFFVLSWLAYGILWISTLMSVVSIGEFLVILFSNIGHSLSSRTPSIPIISVHFSLIQLEYFLLNYLPVQTT